MKCLCGAKTFLKTLYSESTLYSECLSDQLLEASNTELRKIYRLLDFNAFPLLIHSPTQLLILMRTESALGMQRVLRFSKSTFNVDSNLLILWDSTKDLSWLFLRHFPIPSRPSGSSVRTGSCHFWAMLEFRESVLSEQGVQAQYLAILLGFLHIWRCSQRADVALLLRVLYFLF